MMLMGRTVSHLVARCMHAGIPGGNANVRPIIWARGKQFEFELVQADNVSVSLGRVETLYQHESDLFQEIADAHVRWGVPTREMLAAAFPHGVWNQ